MPILDEIKKFDINKCLRENFHLNKNPFTPKELFSDGLTADEVKTHDRVFQGRKEIVESIITGIRAGDSYKSVLYGSKGVGKSSILNLCLYALSNDYITIKIRILKEDVNEKVFQKKILRAVATALTSRILKTDGLNLESIRKKIQQFFKPGAVKELDATAALAFLFSSDQVTYEESTQDKEAINLHLGPVPIGFTMKSEYVNAAKTMTSYAHIPETDLMRILKSAHKLTLEFGFKGIVLGIDDGDKLNDAELERMLLNLLKGMFYADAKYHLMVVCARDVIELDVKDLFSDNFISPLSKDDVLRALNEMYKSESVGEKEIYDFFDKEVLAELYEESNGLMRDAVILCGECIKKACSEKKERIDKDVFNSVRVREEAAAAVKLMTMNHISTEYKVVTYLMENKEGYSSDENFQKSVGVIQSRLTQILRELENKGVLKSRKEKRRRVYFLKGGIEEVLKY
ncbi:hypothetical protein BEH94_01945 [Candidatus Altiarchaeales archaeon WOR_SM1_SCG]|nr:hypothetical protein BEH94_01945 [Candidatus Altiarchaeales archaeon WOR_SM1_SCG]